jgi:uncharacterized membrane protein YidH (DUF202 family)
VEESVVVPLRVSKNVAHSLDEWRVVDELMRRLEERTYVGLIRTALGHLAQEHGLEWPEPRP